MDKDIINENSIKVLEEDINKGKDKGEGKDEKNSMNN